VFVAISGTFGSLGPFVIFMNFMLNFGILLFFCSVSLDISGYYDRFPTDIGFAFENR
jgi:hypothetical protein